MRFGIRAIAYSSLAGNIRNIIVRLGLGRNQAHAAASQHAYCGRDSVVDNERSMRGWNARQYCSLYRGKQWGLHGPSRLG